MADIVLDGFSVVVPVYNNGPSLKEMTERVARMMGERPWEIIFVDDVSTDSSREVLSGLARQFENVSALFQQQNLGQSAAIAVGLAQSRYPVVGVLDGDLEDVPEDFGQLEAALLANRADIVFSSRGSEWKLSSLLFRLTMKALYPSLPLRSCLHFVCTGEVAATVARHTTERDYLLAVVGALNLRGSTISLERAERQHGTTGYPGLRRFRHGIKLITWSLRRRLTPPSRLR